MHPQIPLQLCELLHIPALENAIKETLDTATELVEAPEIQVNPKTNPVCGFKPMTSNC